jgi:peroxiredoxin
MEALSAGLRAPEFTLPSSPGPSTSLAEHRGHPVILVFYPGDWTPVCGDQLTLYNELLLEFARYNAAMLAISVDSVWSHAAFAADRRLKVSLLSDFEPKGKVARGYGVYNEKSGTAQRALFVVDGEGVISWSFVADDDVNPGADGILLALEALSERKP